MERIQPMLGVAVRISVDCNCWSFQAVEVSELEAAERPEAQEKQNKHLLSSCTPAAWNVHESFFLVLIVIVYSQELQHKQTKACIKPQHAFAWAVQL